MSTTPNSSTIASLSRRGSAGDESAIEAITSLVESRIRETQNALWWAELVRSGLRIVIVILACTLGFIVVDQWIYSPGIATRSVCILCLLGWIVSQFVTRVVPILRGEIRPEYAARSLERDDPSMRQDLTSYVTLRDQQDSPDLRGKVIRSVGAHAAHRLREHDALPSEATGTLQWWLVTASLLASIVLYSAFSPKNSLQSASRLMLPFANIEPAKRVKISDVLPGNTEVMAGRSIEVSAVVEGTRLGDEVVCRWQNGDRENQLTLNLNDDSRRYVGEISLDHFASGEVLYEISAGDDIAGPYTLRVKDVPVVAVQSVRYVPPAYMQQEPHTSSSAAITAMDGTKVTVNARSNRPVVKATIQFNPRELGDSVHATAGVLAMQLDESATNLTVTFPVRNVRERSSAVQLESYRILVEDESGQSNPNPIVYPIRVTPDLAPEITIVMPKQSPKEIPVDAQQVIEIHATDADYGLHTIELEIRRGIEVVNRMTLWSDKKGVKGNQIVEYRFRPQHHFLRVGDIVRVTAIATDNRQDDNDPLITPNQRTTDPIELRIVASEPVPNELGNGDGLSSPDKKKTESPDANDTSDQGAQGGGGSESGASQAKGKQQGNQQGDSSGEANGDSNESNEENQKSGSSGNSGKQGESKNNPENMPDRENTEGGQGEPEEMSDPSQDPSSQQSSNGKEQEGNSPSNDLDQNPSSGGRPQHDGEAIERIKEFLNNKNDQQSGKQDEQQGNSKNQGDSGHSDSEKSGDEKNGASQSKPQTDESKQGESKQGESKQGDSKQGESKQGDSKQGDSKQGDSKQGESKQGESKQGESKQGESKQGESKQGESKQGESKPGDSKQGDSKQGDSKQGDSKQDESNQGEPKQGEPKQGESKHGNEPSDADSGDTTGADETSSAEKKPASGAKDSAPDSSSSVPSSQGDASKGEGKKDSENTEKSESEPGNDKGNPNPSGSNLNAAAQPQSGQPQNQSTDSTAPSTQGNSGDGDERNEGEIGADVPATADPVDLDYAKKSTDLVLDYLNETRDKPDKELLEKLDWTEDDLQQFRERWNKIRELKPASDSDSKTDKDWTEALESLGIRKPSATTSQAQEKADRLQGLKDAGNRTPPPPAFRDAFDSFRRAVGK